MLQTLQKISQLFSECTLLPSYIIDDAQNLLFTALASYEPHLPLPFSLKTSLNFYEEAQKRYLIYVPEVCPNYSLIISLENRSNNCDPYFKHLLSELLERHPLKLTNYSPYIQAALTYMETTYDESLTLEKLSTHLGLNKCYFCALFKKETQTTFSAYLNHLRLEKSKLLLKNETLSILEVAIAVGFNSQNYYTILFKKHTGLSPLQYRQQLTPSF